MRIIMTLLYFIISSTLTQVKPLQKHIKNSPKKGLFFLQKACFIGKIYFRKGNFHQRNETIFYTEIKLSAIRIFFRKIEKCKKRKDQHGEVLAFSGEGISFYGGVAKIYDVLGDLRVLLYRHFRNQCSQIRANFLSNSMHGE